MKEIIFLYIKLIDKVFVDPLSVSENLAPSDNSRQRGSDLYEFASLALKAEGNWGRAHRG